MKEQTSFKEEGKIGTLYLVPTPIGNLEDMTFRAIRMLKEANVIACEDTRQTKKLCNHYEIETSLFSYHEHNKAKAGEQLLKRLQLGETIALVSDAGMPAISDPGYDLVQLVLKETDIPVISLPGANAALTSLIASGLPSEQFQFVGFLPRQKKRRQEVLEEIQYHKATLLFYEAPHRLKETLLALYEHLGNRRLSICRELTKRFEEYQRGTLEEALQWVEQGVVKGEFCLVVEGANEEAEQENKWWEALSSVQHVDHYISLGMTSKQAIKQVAEERDEPKREIYQQYHQ
ncbi:16S rRNA (cytidine(1402)-2'-O)-methyltransferase [Alkalihalobacillus sp. 1P02AB]|uniref:16S rRNA (cytidine(1402)-2'-O)-methyltransferase n=1 Tax=Alkalihalobacillus sp. 1P02AB TaxID=3132260 RepID=UPI0039A407BC